MGAQPVNEGYGEGDGAAVSDEQKLAIKGAADDSEVLLFDLA